MDAEYNALLETLFESVDMKESTEKSLMDLIDSQVELCRINNMERVDDFKDIMIEFVGKYMGWDATKDNLKELYSEVFTKNEMKEIVEFYQSDTGRKIFRMLPLIMSKARDIRNRIMDEHSDELESMMICKLSRVDA